MDFVSSLSYPKIKPKKLPIKLKPKTKPTPKSKSKPKTKPKPKPKKDRMKFGKTLLDAPIKPRKLTVRNKYYLEPIKTPLPTPLEPTPYLPPKPQRPTPKQSRLRRVAPVSLPRNRLPMKVDKKSKKAN